MEARVAVRVLRVHVDAFESQAVDEGHKVQKVTLPFKHHGGTVHDVVQEGRVVLLTAHAYLLLRHAGAHVKGLVEGLLRPSGDELVQWGVLHGDG